jgi:hypothetical protein
VRIKEEVVLLVEQKCEKRGNKSFLKRKEKEEEKKIVLKCKRK